MYNGKEQIIRSFFLLFFCYKYLIYNLYTDPNAVFSSFNFPNRRMGIEHNDQGYLTKIHPGLQNFKVVPGISGVPGTISFESIARPGHFLRHSNYLMWLHKYQNTDLYKKDASFYPRYNKYFPVSCGCFKIK